MSADTNAPDENEQPAENTNAAENEQPAENENGEGENGRHPAMALIERDDPEAGELPRDFPEDAYRFIAVGNGHSTSRTEGLGMDPETPAGVTFPAGAEIPIEHAAAAWAAFGGSSLIAVDENGNRVDRDNRGRVAVSPARVNERQEQIRDAIAEWQSGRQFKLGDDPLDYEGMVRQYPSRPTENEQQRQREQDERIAAIAAEVVKATTGGANGPSVEQTAAEAVKAAFAEMKGTTGDVEPPAEGEAAAYECDRCGATFNSPMALNGHMKAHRADTAGSDPEADQ